MPYAKRGCVACRATDGRELRLGELCLPMNAMSVGIARRHVVDLARAWGVAGEVLELAALLCSEIVTNAVVHPKCPAAGAVIRVSVIRDGRRLVIECRDPSAELPRVLSVPNPLLENGRGMCLVATLAYDYGVDLTDEDGKTVWFELLAWPGADEVAVQPEIVA